MDKGFVDIFCEVVAIILLLWITWELQNIASTLRSILDEIRSK